MHGLDGLDKTGPAYRIVAERFAEKGYAVYLLHYFDRTGTNAKQLEILLPSICKYLNNELRDAETKKQLDHLYDQWESTVKDAAAFLKSQPNVDKKQIALAGFSIGGFLSLSVAAEKDMGIAAVVVCSGGVRPGLKIKSLPPLLVLHGEKDEIVPIKHARNLAACWAGQVQFKRYPNAGHNLFANPFVAQDAESTVQAFLRKQFPSETSNLIGKAAPLK